MYASTREIRPCGMKQRRGHEARSAKGWSEWTPGKGRQTYVFLKFGDGFLRFGDGFLRFGDDSLGLAMVSLGLAMVSLGLAMVSLGLAMSP